MEETKNKFIVLSYSLYDTTKGDDGNELSPQKMKQTPDLLRKQKQNKNHCS